MGIQAGPFGGLRLLFELRRALTGSSKVELEAGPFGGLRHRDRAESADLPEMEIEAGLFGGLRLTHLTCNN